MKRNLIAVVVLVVSAVVGYLVVGQFELTINRFFAATGCVSSFQGGGLEGQVYGDGTARITNNTDRDCTVTLASYGVTRGGDAIEGQFLHDQKTVTVSVGQTIGRAQLSVGNPGCRTQYDLFVGSNPLVPPYYNGYNLVGYAYGGSGLCAEGGGGGGGGGTPTPPPPPPGSSTLTAVCVRGTTPSVQLSWNIPANSIQNVIQRTGAAGSYGNTDALNLSFPANQTSHTDTTPVFGSTYTYRHKPSPNVVSNAVTIAVTMADCGPLTTTTPTPTATPAPTPTPFPVCRNSLQRSVATTCPGPGQLCFPVESFTYDYARPTALTLNYSVGPQHCSSLRLHVSVDGVETAVSQVLGWPGGPGPTSISGLAIGNVSAGTHHITVQAEGITSGCNAGDMLSWAGTLTVNSAVDQCAATPTPTPTATVCPAPTPPQCPDGRSPSPVYGQDGCITGWTCPTPTPTPTGTGTPTPTPTPTSLVCAPTSQTVSVNQTADLQASGGTGAYSWSAPGGTPQSSASGNTYRVSYPSAGGYTVLVNDGQSFAQCTVSVTTEAVTPTPTFTATPPPGDVALQMEKTVRNVSRGTQESEQTPASPGETVEFIIRVRSVGSQTAFGVRVEDTLPTGLTFVNGSASIDGQIQPSMTSPLFPPVDMPPGSQKTFRFSALVGANAGTPGQNVDVTNIAYATVPGTGIQISDTAVVVIVRVAGGTIPPVAQVPTGPGEASVLALVVAAIVTLLYVGYTSTDAFRRREAGGIADKGGGHPDFR